MGRSAPSRPAVKSLPPSKWWDKQPKKITRLRTGHIVAADALTTLKSLNSDVADLVFVDPPFNLGKSYGKSAKKADRKKEDEYGTFINEVLSECSRVLRPGGSLFFYHIPKRAVQFIPELNRGLSFRHWIAVGMKNGFVRSSNLYPAHYALLHYTKGEPATLIRPKIQPATCPHCGEYIRDYGGYLEHVVDGINLSDFWDDVSPVRHTKYKYRAENELPMIIVKRILDIAGTRGGLLIDVFSGSGGAVVAARTKGMRYIAIDREAQNCALILSRLQQITKRGKGS